MPTTIANQEQHDPEAAHIRAKLLNKLGIHNEKYIARAAPVATAAQQRRIRVLRDQGIGHSIQLVNPPDGSALRDPLDGALPHIEPLNVRPSSLCHILQDRNNGKGSRHVIFNDQVSVVDIPMRNEYSKRIRSLMWSSAADLKENMQRNSAEFEAEGWNWESVLEDEGMYIDASSGELVHPVHVDND